MSNAETRRLKVLFITRKWPPATGGMETYSRDLTAALGAYVDLDVHALPGRPEGRPPSAAALARFLASTKIMLARRARHYDLIHLGDMVLYPLAGVIRAMSPETTLIMTVHGLDMIYGRRKGWKPAIYRQFTSTAANLSLIDRYVANSRNTKAIAEEIGFQPTDAVPLGVASPAEAPAWEPDGKTLLVVGRIVHRKGAAWFAENVLPRLDGYRLLVAGNPWDKDEVRRLEAADRVDVLGRVGDDEMTRLRARATAVLMPNIPSFDGTDVEGFGIAALEPPAAGVPVIAARVEGIPDAVRDGETGFLVPSGDAPAWVDAIREIEGWAAEQRRAFSDAARSAVAEHYSWDRVARDTFASYCRARIHPEP